MEALRQSVGRERALKAPKSSKKAPTGQKEMLLPITGKKPAKEAAAKKTSAKPQRKSA
jgi:DNA end-binding protein Ku